jgi:exopolysaccharide biosynthesis protein
MKVGSVALKAGRILIAVWCLVLTACVPQDFPSASPPSTSSPSTSSPGASSPSTSSPSASAPIILTQPAPTAASRDTGWRQVDTALEFRRLPLAIDQQQADLTILRLDPKAYHIRVAYDTGRPGRISDWATAVKPVALINGGYFDEKKKATALVIFDGIAKGTSYRGFGGMVVVNQQGSFELRSLRQQPYDPAEPLQQAMQSSPMLIQPGGVLSDLEVDDKRSRRTVIARDTGGRILLMVCDFPVFTLKELAKLLKESDLELDAALNLDGGSSTGMYLRTSAMNFTIDSFDTVPLVLTVDKQE